MSRRYVLTISAKDVNATLLRSPMGERVSVQGMMGRVLPCDIGKRVYQVAPRVYQVENNDQRDERINAGKVQS